MLVLKEQTSAPSLVAGPAGLQGRGESVAVKLHETSAQRLRCTCGSPLPLQVRLALRSRTRPVFDGRWCCGNVCLQARVAGALKREESGATAGAHQHRIPLGLLLLSTGRISQADLRDALTLQRSSGERIGDVLSRECGLSELALAQALATQWGCDVWNGPEEPYAEKMAAVAPLPILERTGAVPVSVGTGRQIRVISAAGLDAQAIFALQRMHAKAVHGCIATATCWRSARESVARGETVPLEEINATDTRDIARHIVRLLQRLQPVESRFVRVHEMLWFRMWLEPAALLGGPVHTTDVMDFIFRMPSRKLPLRSV